MDDATFAVRLQAGARREEILGVRDGALVARVGAPARDGRANRALCRLLARHLGVRPSQIAIVRGERSRDKLVRVDGIDGASVRPRSDAWTETGVRHRCAAARIVRVSART